MKNNRTPLFSKRTLLTPYSLHKTRGQLIKVQLQNNEDIILETQAQPMKLFPLLRFCYRSLFYIFPISKFNKDLCTTKYLKNGRPELLEYGYKDTNLNKASPEALVYVHSVVHSVIKVGNSEDIKFRSKSFIDTDINMSVSNSDFSSNSGVIRIEVNNKRDREDSPVSISSCSSEKVKKKRTLDYFRGKGKREWSPTTSLTLNEVNITAQLDQYRIKSIKCADQVNNLNSMRILFLSHIFPIDRYDNNFCTTRYMKQGRKDFKEYAYKDIKIEKASSEALMYVHSMIHTIIKGSDPENVEFRPQNTTEKNLKQVCLNVVQSKSSIASGSESTFVDKYLMPYIRNVFLVNSPENIIYSLAEGRQIQTRTKPDVMVDLKSNKKERPETTSKYQEEDDYIKLIKHLKESINSQISLGMHKPRPFGVLCEGFKCSYYSMTLVEEGVYLPVHVSSFRLAESELSLMDVAMIVESLEVAKNYIGCFEEAYVSRTTKNKTMKRFKTESFKTKFGKSENKEK